MTESISWDQLIEEAGDTLATNFDPLPADDYDLEVVEASHVKTKTVPSKDMFKIQAKVVGGAFNNRRIFDNIVLVTDSKQALGFFFRKMGAMGLSMDYFKSKPSNEAIASALKGRKFRAKIGQRTYQGEIQNEIKNYYPPRAGESAVAAPAGSAPAPVPGASAPPVPSAAPAPAPAPAAAPAPTEAAVEAPAAPSAPAAPPVPKPPF